MENGVIKFNDEELFIDVMDNYIIWRLRDIIDMLSSDDDFEDYEGVIEACELLLEYMEG